MTAEELRGVLPYAPTPRELKSARLRAGISLKYISNGLGLAPSTLEAVEDGTITAMEPVRVEWALLILKAPPLPPLSYRLASSRCVIFMVIALVEVIGGVLFFWSCQ